MRTIRFVKVAAVTVVAAAGWSLLPGAAGAQTISPPGGISITSGPLCTGAAPGQSEPVSITLPSSSVNDKVDVALLLDDTGSFSGQWSSVASTFTSVVDQLQTALPTTSLGFGVSMFKDYGGAWSAQDGDTNTSRPFILDQPIVTAATAGGTSALGTLVSNAVGLADQLPGSGGDGPETDLEGLSQLATGTGLDGNGNGSTLDSGPAGALATQENPGVSGDVPPFSSNVALTSGTLGGIGWRPGALHLVIVATDTGTVAAFASSAAIPSTITSINGDSEPVANFASTSTNPGSNRFGYVADTTDPATNTVEGAVAPAGAATVQGTIAALNKLGIRVLGMGPGAAPTSEGGPSGSESVWMSSVARLTGATDSSGTPLVFSTSGSPSDLATAIVNTVEESATRPVDVGISTSALPAGVTSVTPSPSTVDNVSPGGTASFELTLKGDGSAIDGNFDVNFVDTSSGGQLGSVPVAVHCFTAGPAGTQGYRLLGGDGGIFDYGVPFYGSTGADLAACPPVTADRIMPDGSCWSMATTPDTNGYWILNASTGAIVPFGDAGSYGSPQASLAGTPRDLLPTFLGIAATPDGKGYWVLELPPRGVAKVVPYGDATFEGDATTISGSPAHLGLPVGIAATPDGKGYWIVESDGGVFAFGDAGYHGSMGGTHLNGGVVGIAATPDGAGYWLVASDGGVFAFGDAVFGGSMGGVTLVSPVSGIAADPAGGYWLSAGDGGVFALGGAPFLGSMGGQPLNQGIFAINSASRAAS